MHKHSRPMRNEMKLKEILMGSAQHEWLCLKDSKYILFEILAHRTWKGSTSSCRPSKPDLVIWLVLPAGASTALPFPMCQDFKQNILGILEAYPFTLRIQFCCTFQLYQIPDQPTVTIIITMVQFKFCKCIPAYGSTFVKLL